MGDRREFLLAAGAALAAARIPGAPPEAPVAQAPDWGRFFPPLGRSAGGTPLVYLDSAATTRRATPVLEALSRFYTQDNANPTPLHEPGRRAQAAYDGARATVAEFLGARDPLEVVFTRGTTDAINLVAATWGPANLHPGDEILLGVGEHASNLVPWQMAAQRTGATIVTFGLQEDGSLDLADFEARLSSRTRLVAVSQVSNVLGIVNPIEAICRLARRAGALVLVDAAQSAPHLPIDVGALGCDFLALSSHKLTGPMGSGVLWGRAELLEAMPPYQGGSNMAHAVGFDHLELSAKALKFGAGTPNVADAVGLAAALRFLAALGWPALIAHGHRLAAHLFSRLREIPGVTVVGGASPEKRIPLAAFTVRGREPAEIARGLDREGVAVRAGDLAALPLLRRFGVESAVRVSCYLYTTEAEIDRMAEVLRRLTKAS